MTDVRTFGDMIDRISREVRRTGLTAEIRDSIVSAIDEFETERFWFNEGVATATTSADQPSLAFATNFHQIDRLELTGSAVNTEFLPQITFEELRENLEGNPTTGQPTRFSVFRNEIYLYPIPDAVYTLKAWGQLQLTDISASATAGVTSAWVTDAEELIRCRAKENLFRHRLRNEQQAIVMALQSARATARLKAHTRRKLSTGRIRPYEI